MPSAWPAATLTGLGKVHKNKFFSVFAQKETKKPPFVDYAHVDSVSR